MSETLTVDEFEKRLGGLRRGQTYNIAASDLEHGVVVTRRLKAIQSNNQCFGIKFTISFTMFPLSVQVKLW